MRARRPSRRPRTKSQTCASNGLRRTLRSKREVAGRPPRSGRGPELEPGRATIHLGLRPRPVRGRDAPVPRLRLCGRAVSALAQSTAAPALSLLPSAGASGGARSGGGAGRRPLFRSSLNRRVPLAWTCQRRGSSNPRPQDPKSCALPIELVAWRSLKGFEPPASRHPGRSTTELQPRPAKAEHALRKAARASRVSGEPGHMAFGGGIEREIPAKLARHDNIRVSRATRAPGQRQSSSRRPGAAISCNVHVGTGSIGVALSGVKERAWVIAFLSRSTNSRVN